MSTLDQIALSLNPIPDKASDGHGYTRHYAQHFSHLRNKPIRLLEIGVWEGASLALWSRYFEKAHIVGADIDITRCKELPQRCRLWECNQASHESLINMAREVGPWDIIIDDGSHDPQHQVITFNALWPYLNLSGLYAVEDLHVNYHTGYDGSMVAFLGGTLQADLHARGKLSYATIANNSLNVQEKLQGRECEVEAIHLYRHLAIIEKGGNRA